MSTLDGYVADSDGGTGFLQAFEGMDPGYDEFLAGIHTVVLGRATYDQMMSSGAGWPHAAKRGLVVTARPIGEAPSGVKAWHQGIEALAEHLRAQPGEAWVVGGPRLLGAFLEQGTLDRLEFCVLPLRLGRGVPLFPQVGPTQALWLREVHRLDLGVVKLDYELQGVRGGSSLASTSAGQGSL